MRKSIKGFALLAAIPLALTACGSDSGGDESAAAIPTDPSEISGTITWWDTSDSTAEAPAFKNLVKQFEEAYPNVTVDYQNVPFSEAQNKYKTAAQADQAPDVLRSEVAWTPEFASLGYLLPLDGTPLDTQDEYLPTPLSSNIYEDVLYGVPQVTDAPALLYNKELLQNANVEVPATWDDVRAAAKPLKDAGVDTLYSATGGYFVQPYLYAFGGNTLDDETQTIEINNEQSVAGWQEALDLIDEGAAVKPDPNDAYNEQQRLFKDGKLAMVINGPWSVADDLTGKAFKDNEENLGVAMTPAGPDGLKGTPVGGHNYVIYGGTQNEAASIAFVSFMNSADSQAYLATELGLLPTRGAVYDDPEVAKQQFVKAFQPVVEQATPRAWIPEGGQIFVSMDEQWIKMYQGDVDAQTGANNIAEAWMEFLPEGWTDPNAG